MTGNELKKIRTTLKRNGKTGMTQAEFATLLEYAHYQRVLELEAYGKRKIPRDAERRVRLLQLNESV